MNNAYFGKLYSNEEIECALKKYPQLRYYISEDIARETAGYIAKGYIVGWFQGGAEFGPRALGNRSILADPRNPDTKDILNKRVKFREHFRPFAPAVLWEHQTEYFKLNIQNPYMLIVKDVREDKRSIIPAVTHVDGTGRIQTVTKEYNGPFYALISRFNELTGVPVVLNTSFNIKGEPIVESPEDAVKCFTGTQIDCLAIGDYIVLKG